MTAPTIAIAKIMATVAPMMYMSVFDAGVCGSSAGVAVVIGEGAGVLIISGIAGILSGITGASRFGELSRGIKSTVPKL